MTTVLLVGAGTVGRRAARQLAETRGVDRILLADRVAGRAKEVAAAVGDPVEALGWSPAEQVPDGVDVVAVAAEAVSEPAIALRAVEARVPAAFCSDDAAGAAALLDLDEAARSAGVAVAVGCGLAPGLSDVLARHAADALDEVIEIHVARCGAAGPACHQSAAIGAHGSVDEWRDRGWIRERAGSGHTLIWFPDPVGGRDCRRASSGQATLLVDAFRGLRRVSMRMASAHGVKGRREARRRPDPDGEWGAVWVEVRGRRGRSEEILVYGAVDRMAFASAAVLAVSATALAGIGETAIAGPGAHGLAALVEPVPFLAELARRGVQAAAFEGARF